MAKKGHIMSKTTLLHYAKELGGESVSVLVKPPLSTETKAKRLVYAKKLAHRPVEAWRKVVFLDEAAYAPTTPGRIIKLKGQPTPTKHIDKRAPKIHFMGYISAAGKKSALNVLKPGETWTAARLVKLIRGLKQPGVEVVLDGASPHNRLKRELVATGATVLPHPPYSPDLNPIENVWAVVKAKAAAQGPRNAEEVVKALKAAWREITPTRFKAYADSMHQRLQVVLQGGGGAYKVLT